MVPLNNACGKELYILCVCFKVTRLVHATKIKQITCWVSNPWCKQYQVWMIKCWGSTLSAVRVQNWTKVLSDQDSSETGAQEGCVGVGSHMHPVVVVHVHQEGQWLSEDDAGPHNHVANLTPHNLQGSKDTQWNLCVWVCGWVDVGDMHGTWGQAS